MDGTENTEPTVRIEQEKSIYVTTLAFSIEGGKFHIFMKFEIIRLCKTKIDVFRSKNIRFSIEFSTQYYCIMQIMLKILFLVSNFFLPIKFL